MTEPIVHPTPLLHFTSKAFVLDRSRTYDQHMGTRYPINKPDGLWLSAGFAWHEASEEMDFVDWEAAFEITLPPSFKLLTISKPEQLDAFTREYGGPPKQSVFENDPGIIELMRSHDEMLRVIGVDRELFEWRINWVKVAEQFDGIAIIPHIKMRRLALLWYYGWDCASACIWNLEGVNAKHVGEWKKP